jgi:hypothetical protein
MSKYKMEDAIIVDTDKATQSWKETSNWNGNNHISRATGSQWRHQTLYRSSKGRYYLEYTSQMQGIMPRASFISNEEACRWLLLMERELPEDLKSLEGEICE